MFSLLIYRLLIILLSPLLLLALLLRSLSNKQYRQRISERLGFFPKPCQQGGIVVHAASVGEIIALKPFVEQLLAHYPNQAVTVTTFTPTGSEQAKKIFGERVQHGFLPLDIFPCTQLFLSRLKPKLVIFMETELWPSLIAQCANRQIKLLLINGRLSKKSMKSYQKINALITPTLNRFDKILCQSQDNYENFLQLGATPNRCEISGNLKFDLTINQATLDKAQQLQQFLPENRPVWLVASTHEGDEEIALKAFKQVKNQFPTLLLILVPRHPERFKQVASLCLNHHFSLAKRSEETQVIEQDIWLLDTLGELMATFSLADLVTMGGSFSHIGGHNPLEPALFKKAIIVGPNMSNFVEMMQQLQQHHAITQLPSVTNSDKDKHSQALASAAIALLENQQQAQLLGEQAHQVVMANQGASAQTLAEVKALIND
ncbi:MAG: lipid IV(A) 3-deoxy-D-manno-octulosonic acid transferase [Colwellia sp.]|nr:lipid IV(A) 3-deoxy-D-manno-octulosonic acid transferase [Colwellia sp.]MCW8864849.1 lipid IV(A) 3-deoxy-D-manno-octulosonic acid transferase [Colwellia sp.]MCW9080990.1 lipid IV(A) 3-deoxy-D-manno-octulosonic acid transferase [Colwellia sp.]